MATIYVLFVIAMMAGGPAIVPPIVITSAEVCEELKVVLVEVMKADDDYAGGAQGWCLEWQTATTRRTAYDY